MIEVFHFGVVEFQNHITLLQTGCFCGSSPTHMVDYHFRHRAWDIELAPRACIQFLNLYRRQRVSLNDSDLAFFLRGDAKAVEIIGDTGSRDTASERSAQSDNHSNHFAVLDQRSARIPLI